MWSRCCEWFLECWAYHVIARSVPTSRAIRGIVYSKKMLWMMFGVLSISSYNRICITVYSYLRNRQSEEDDVSDVWSFEHIISYQDLFHSLELFEEPPIRSRCCESCLEYWAPHLLNRSAPPSRAILGTAYSKEMLGMMFSGCDSTKPKKQDLFHRL